MIVGAQKAGTTSLNAYLNEHPNILGHPQNEFNYFRDDESYKNNFEDEFKRCFTKGDLERSTHIIAKNAALYNGEEAIKRLSEHNPDCKLVFVIREPVSRAYSSYSMEVFNGWLKRDFSELKDVIESDRKEDTLYRLLIELGLYADHLKLMLKYFPKEQIRVLLFKDLKHDPLSVTQELYQWLGVDESFQPNTEVAHNVTRKAKSSFLSNLTIRLRKNSNPIKRFAKWILPYSWFSKIGNFIVESNKSSEKIEPMSDEMKRYLKAFYLPHIEEVEMITGLDLSSWK